MSAMTPEQFASGITFGEGCPKGLVIWAVIQLSHFLGYLSDRFFNSRH
jgi:hypothetical protein